MNWVLLRGLWREQAHWGNFPHMLKQAFPGDRLIMLDIPGNGRRLHEDSPTRIEHMVDHLRDSLCRQGVKGPMNLLGISMGGMMICDWIMTYPHEISHAVIINSSLRSYSAPYKRLKYHNLKNLARIAVAPSTERESFIVDMVSNRPSERLKAIENWSKIASARPIRKINGLRQMIAAMRYQPPHIPPEVPTLILNSEGDRLVDHKCSIDIANIWKAPIFTHPTAGHDLVLDDPDWVIEKIKTWIQTCSDPCH